MGLLHASVLPALRGAVQTDYSDHFHLRDHPDFASSIDRMDRTEWSE